MAIQSTPLTTPAELGQAIRARRKAVGLTQGELADAAGTSLRLVSEVERGKANARLESVLKLLAELGLRLELGSR
ncbi:MAG TPA: type II toxin-antitoxin system Y4mF family antitoxin [Solirubrobacterales bacterium]|nr:type II toxin-antitoxin system Y4mF family antitoxin [Solirubrobacterales bacterium]